MITRAKRLARGLPHRRYEALKQCADRVAAFCGLVLLTPLLPLAAVIIKLDSPGPVLFRQRRIGRDGVPFTLYKLRTLRADSDPYVAKREPDARATRVGAFLRRLGWDELPQLAAVLTGHMSLVGPRPEMPFIVETYTPGERRRLAIKPGITGYWQVAAPKTQSMRASLAYDRFYLRHRSARLDAWILARTLAIAIGRPPAPRRRVVRHGPARDRIAVAEILEATAGGTLTHLDLLLGRIDRAKIDVSLVCSTTRGHAIDGKIEGYRQRGIAVHVIDMVRRIDPIRDLASVARLYVHLRRHPVDIVHTHSSKAGFVGRLAARLARVPVVIHTAHGFAFQDDRHPWVRPLYVAIERLAGRWTTVLLCVSRDERGLALAHGLVDPARAEVIYNSIDATAADACLEPDAALRARLGLEAATHLVGTVANLRPEKGLDDFIHAAGLVRDRRDDVSFLIVGSGSLAPRLEEQIARLGLTGRVVITHAEGAIWPYLSIMDVFVSTSLREGLPYAILEAMAMRRAIVATDVTGSRELIEDGATGRLVPPRDPARVADAVLGLLASADARTAFGAAARRRVEERHDIARAIPALESLYASALRRTRVRKPVPSTLDAEVEVNG
jgi:lipopolysaccharide/colanic/teichoic acid biosynthesis glycosyltransferase/glycosyltransferase involved in cell wall biosynthesis